MQYIKKDDGTVYIVLHADVRYTYATVALAGNIKYTVGKKITFAVAEFDNIDDHLKGNSSKLIREGLTILVKGDVEEDMILALIAQRLDGEIYDIGY